MLRQGHMTSQKEVLYLNYHVFGHGHKTLSKRIVMERFFHVKSFVMKLENASI